MVRVGGYRRVGVPRRARKPSVRAALLRETAAEGRTRDLLDASARVLSARARRVCSLTFLCRLDALALLSDTGRVAAVVLDVIARAAIVRCAVRREPACGDSLYSGEERTEGEPR